MLTILYVENHPTFAQVVIASFLEDYAVTVVPSLAAARAALEAAAFDVLLVDYDLDDGKGAELVRELRRAEYRGLIVAASAHEEGNTELVRAGANAVCAKTQFAGINGVLYSLGLDVEPPS